MEVSKVRQEYKDWPTAMKVGAWGTGIYVFLAVVYVMTHWGDVTGLDPEELSQFLRGIAVPLGFLWLVVAIFLLTNEVARTRKALELHTEKLKEFDRKDVG
jgi:hypothetical protein